MGTAPGSCPEPTRTFENARRTSAASATSLPPTQLYIFSRGLIHAILEQLVAIESFHQGVL